MRKHQTEHHTETLNPKHATKTRYEKKHFKTPCKHTTQDHKTKTPNETPY